MIRQSTEKDLNTIFEITQSCAKALRNQGVFQWNEHYPTPSIFEKDIDRNESYVYIEKEEIIGTIVLSELKDEEYNLIQWLTPDNRNLYIHRLAVHPNYWGQGIAKNLMDWAENIAQQKQYLSIRLDTFSQNPRNLKFYESRGYQRLGSIYFPNQSEFPFYCYELIL